MPKPASGPRPPGPPGRPPRDPCAKTRPPASNVTTATAAVNQRKRFMCFLPINVFRIALHWTVLLWPRHGGAMTCKWLNDTPLICHNLAVSPPWHLRHNIARTMTWLLARIAAVSLLVGGIGIMNIMLARDRHLLRVLSRSEGCSTRSDRRAAV